ncbi:MAG: hypothetical protein Q8L35_03170 [Actinomycetota bacterium]|nr:hypothetical protein [Actinomycetota bacterium]
MNRLLKFFKTIWTSKITTAAFLAIGLGALAVSVLYNFGPPSPTKVMVRFAFSLVFFLHIFTVYPRQLKYRLLGTEDGLLRSRERSPASLPFYLLSTAVLAVSFLARVWHLTKFLTVDESKWLIFRVPGFFSNLLAFNWQNLLISDKPGITLAWITEAGLLFTNKEGNGLNMADPQLLLASRLPLVIANILLLFWLTSLVRRATKSEPAALLFLVLTATNPTIMGMAPIVNPDSISWFFPLATVLAFFLYLRECRPWDLAICALIFTGGVLNKFNTLIILPFLPIMAILYYLFTEPKPAGFFKAAAAAIARLYLLGWLIATCLWPYLLLAPWQYLDQTLLRPVVKPLSIPIIVCLLIFWFFNDAVEKGLQRFDKTLKTGILIAAPLVSLAAIGATVWLTPVLPSVEKATKVQAPFFRLVINNYYYHLYSQTTLTVVLYAIALLALAAIALKPGESSPALPLSIVSVLFILFYLGGSAATGHITSPRYQIPVFPAVGLLVVGAFMPAMTAVGRAWLARAAVVGVAIVNFALVLAFAPYYLFYHNYFLPPGKLVFEGWGLGGYEAAQFLNEKPGAKKMRAYATYGGFDNFFVGQPLRRDEDPFNPPVNYLVIFEQSPARVMLGNDPATDAYWRRQAKPEWEWVVNGVPIVKVVKFKRTRL